MICESLQRSATSLTNIRMIVAKTSCAAAGECLALLPDSLADLLNRNSIVALALAVVVGAGAWHYFGRSDSGAGQRTWRRCMRPAGA